MSLSTPLKKQFPLKLLGIDNVICSNEEVLEFLELYVPPSSISYLHFDSYQKFYVVFLNDIDSVCTLVGKRLSYSQCKIDILPLLDYYVVRNVYPDLTNEDLIDIFRPFGNVYDVKAHHVLPNSSKFSHVLSGNREISFMLPGHEIGVSVPGSVVYMPHTFHIIKYCPACSTEGHAMLHCPDIEDNCLPQETSVELESDIELEDFNVKGMLSDDDKFLLANEKSEQSNVGGHSLEKVDGTETIICETHENSQQTTEVYKEKRKYRKKYWIDASWTISTKTRKSSKTVVYFVKRKYKKRKGHEKHNRLHPNSERNKKKKSRGKRKWKRAPFKRGRQRKDPEAQDQPSLLLKEVTKKTYYERKKSYKLKQTLKHKSRKETKIYLKKAPLKVGRPRKNPKALDQPRSLQKVTEKTPLKVGRPRKSPEAPDQPRSLQKVTEKTPLKVGRPKKNPEALDQPPSLQKVIEKTCLGNGRSIKKPEVLDKTPFLQDITEKICLDNETPGNDDEVSVQTPSLLEKITGKSCLGRGKPRKNPEFSDQTPFLQHVTEKSTDEDEICLRSFSLHASLEKMVRNSEGILPIFVLKRLLLMDLRNKKDIISYISKFTLHFDQVFHQFKKLQSQIIESDDFHLSKNDHYQTKLFCLMKTLLREKSRHRAFTLS
ncbi:uncharacterized protein [Parasteatoda tepidariorum]|uniref:uncharacterized protein isoform X9 n=1 Tax=Parasteatoda tepidariorum TaxID=114398 RepID=UPI001C722D04|nr:uncharacterized protein LOC107440902 isoform X10 [Parasteatoda tepidariorum]